MSSYRRGQPTVTKPEPLQPKRGVRYLRVSSIRQTYTDSDLSRDGNSIETQREECSRKAQAMGVVVQDEFVEPGKSAQTIEQRPEFRRLLAYLAEHHEIGYVFVYSRSRAFRNVEDAVLTRKHLRGLGVKIVSTKEDFGDSLEAEFMETISDGMNELQNRRNGEDIRMKMAHKARNGGTIGRAPIGYLNTRVEVEGRLINSIAIDEDRAPLVRIAFELYASGEYSIDALQASLTQQGLSAKPSPRWPARRPISKNSLLRILADPYYVGLTCYDGQLYPGRHPALVTQALFDRVQDVLDTRSSAGTRQRVHSHFLKGLLRCERCRSHGRESRLIYSEGRGRSGRRYAYYLCRGHQDGQCDLRHLPLGSVEDAVEAFLGTVTSSVTRTAELEPALRDRLETELAVSRELDSNLGRELTSLARAENRLLDAVEDGTLPFQAVRARLKDIEGKRVILRQRLVANRSALDVSQQGLRAALSRARDLPDLYRSVHDPSTRALILQGMFRVIYVDEERDPSPTRVVGRNVD